MTNSELFSQNLKRWALFCPEGVAKVAESTCPEVSLCQTGAGKLNLKVTKGGETFYLHSQEDPLAEANAWFKGLSLKDIQVIYVFGLGLGYYYEACREWLKSSQNHTLVFFEDDPQVIHRFLESERAAALLKDSHVHILLFEDHSPDSALGCNHLTLPFAYLEVTSTALISYSIHRKEAYNEWKSKALFFTKMNHFAVAEFNHFGLGIFRNFYHNTLEIPFSYLANRLFGKFKNIPAIICGAGPSLDKNIEVLAKVRDRALIFAGGTALNALNAQGVMPHFGVGIDPNQTYLKRLMMNTGYELPFFYRSRMVYEGVQVMHGAKLFVTGSAGYGLGEWIESQLGIKDEEVPEGMNVLNFSLSIANQMGCNPLICAGIDLAYSRGESYAAGIIGHAIHEHKDNFTTKTIDDDLLAKNDIYGKPVFTLLKWMGESMWYAVFNHEHPEKIFINATEGGIGFPAVTNMNLEDVAALYLPKQYAFNVLIHGEIQNCIIPEEVNFDFIVTKFEELLRSLKCCEEIAQEMSNLALKNEMHLHTSGLDDPEIIKELSEKKALFKQQMAFDIILKPFEKAYLSKYSLLYLRLKLDEGLIPEFDLLMQKAKLEAEYAHYLHQTALFHHLLLQEIIKEHKNNKRLSEAAPPPSEPLQKVSVNQRNDLAGQNECYTYDHHRLTIVDAEMGIDYQGTFNPKPEDIDRTFYEDGSLKFEQYYLNKTLHGPATFYSPQGNIMAQAWFWHGKQEGKMFSYYLEGSLHSIQRFFHGQQEGLQQFFYPNGLIKSQLPYHQGKLHGNVLLYHSNGIMARTLQFADGKREGLEKIWNSQGQILIEAYYAADRPVNFAKSWHANGQLNKEILYDQDFRAYQVQEWSAEGVLIPQKIENLDYFESITQETGKLTTALEDILKQLSQTAPLLAGEFEKKPVTETNSPEFPKQMDALHAAMRHLHAVNSEIQTYSQQENSKEALWKNPQTRQELERHLGGISQKMSEELKNVESEFKHLLATLFPKPPPD